MTATSTPPPRKPRITKIWADTIRPDVCRSIKCRRPIWFAQNVRTGNHTPFDTPPAPVAEQLELETSRKMWTIDLDVTISHFATCPEQARFRRAR